MENKFGTNERDEKYFSALVDKFGNCPDIQAILEKELFEKEEKHP